MSKKFDPIRETIILLEKAASASITVNTEISSRSTTLDQSKAMVTLFRSLGISRLATAKVGLWFKKMPLVDVIVDFKGLRASSGEEAGEMSALMNRTYALVKLILARGLPRVDTYCPEVGVIEGGWRFQC